MTRLLRILVSPLALLAVAAMPLVAQGDGTPDDAIRVNQVGYLPDAPKVAVVCALAPRAVADFEVVDVTGKRVFGPKPAPSAGKFGPCAATYRLDFSALQSPGAYRVRAGSLTSPVVKIGPTVWNGLA